MSNKPQPKTTCEYCGRTLSQYSLKRHVGTPKCTSDYWNRVLRPQHKRAPGMHVVSNHELQAAHLLIGRAGLNPTVAPLIKAVVWEEGTSWRYDAGPAPVWLVPLWLNIALQTCVESRDTVRRAERALKHKQPSAAYKKATAKPRSAPPPPPKVSPADEQALAVARRQHDVLEQDVVTLLLHLQGKNDDAVALSTELDLTAREDAWEYGITYSVDRAGPVLRRWASEVADNL